MRTLILLPLVAAACATVPPLGPADVHRRILETLEKAKSVRTRSTVEGMIGGGEGERDLVSKTTFLLREGNRMKFEGDAKLGEDEVDVRIVADGKVMGVTFIQNGEKSGAPPVPVAPKLTRNFKEALAGLGVGAEINMRRFARPETPDQPAFEFSNFRAGKDPGSILFDFKIAGMEEGGQVTLWYDPATWKVLKRRYTIVLEFIGFKAEIVETFQEWTLDPELPDELFRLKDTK